MTELTGPDLDRIAHALGVVRDQFGPESIERQGAEETLEKVVCRIFDIDYDALQSQPKQEAA